VKRSLTHIKREGIVDTEGAPGRSLQNPFLNNQAIEYWDAEALQRWMSRHNFSPG